MATTIISKTAAFTIADSDLGAGDDSVTYKCTGTFAVTIPSTGVGAGGEFYIESTDGLQTFTTTGATVSLPAGRELKPYPNGTGESSTISIVCEATGTYKADGDLNPTDWSEYSFRAHRNGSDQSLTATGSTVIQFTHTDYNVGNVFNTSTYRFTAPIDGRYQLNASIQTSSGTSVEWIVRLRLNGTTFLSNGPRGVVAGANTVGSNVSDTHELSAGDYVEAIVYQTESASETLQGGTAATFFSGHLVGGIKGATGDSSQGLDHAIFVTATNGQTVGTSAYTVQFDTIVDQTNLDFDLTNNKFVAPTAGWYEFESRVTALSLVGNVRIYSYLTRTTFDSIYFEDWNQRDQTGVGRWGGTVTCWLDAGTECTLVVVSSSGFTLRQTANLESFLAIRKVSGTSHGVEHDRYEIAFTAYDGTGYSLASGATSKIDIDTISYDKGGNFDTTNNRFIAPVKGVYMFNGAVQVGNFNDNEYLHTHLYKNGTTAFASGSRSTISDSGAAGQQARSVVSGQVELNAGEYVDLWAYQNTGTAQTCSSTINNTFLSGCLVQADAKAECSCSAYRSGTQSIGGGSNTKVTLNAVNYNYGNAFDYITNYRFDVPEDGRYTVKGSVGSVTSLPDNKYMQAIIYVDGAQEYAGPKVFSAGGATSCSAEANVDLDLTKGQYVELYVFQNSGGSMSFELNTKLDIRRETTTPEVQNPYSPVVYEYEVTSATNTLTVPAHLLGDRDYRFRLYAVSDEATNNGNVSIYANGDTTATNYEQENYLTTAGSLSAVNDAANSVIGYVTATDTSLFEGSIACVDGIFHCLAGSSRDNAGNVGIYKMAIVNRTTTFTTINALQFSGSQTSIFGVGTRLKIFRD